MDNLKTNTDGQQAVIDTETNNYVKAIEKTVNQWCSEYDNEDFCDLQE